MSKIYDIKIKLLAVEVLKLLKENYSYKVLEEMLNLPAPVLSRYINGRVLPSLKRANEIINIFKNDILQDIVRRKIEFRNGIINITALVSDINLLKMIARIAVHEFRFMKISKILTKETDGIPLATIIGYEVNSNIVVAKNEKELGVDDFIEVKQVYVTGTYSHIYVPRELIKRGDNVLIVDDIIRSGSTVRALISVCEKAKAMPIGVFVIIGKKRSLDELRKEYTMPVKALLTI